ncbi:hypothetical protein CIB84_002492 [Bambusicola thoracicus]|uniref:Uncharacterized protein n=1 Tax=Bambusicola thoracicus TaxID=9083 RepID=A0A2P4TBL2_BAMTH|nr:hypothetical protein CIB84_002492 [Bambusicola thoracicus]
MKQREKMTITVLISSLMFLLKLVSR